jgi:serine protease
MTLSTRNAIALLAAALLIPPAAAQEQSGARRQPSSEAADTDATPRMLVKLRRSPAARGTGAGDAARVAARAGVRVRATRRVSGDLHVLEVENLVPGDEALARLRADPDVEYAEPDRRRYLHALPNDPKYTGQWYLQTISSGASALDAETGWDVTSGTAGVVVAVLDTGVLFDHPDLMRAAAGGRLLPGYDFVASSTAANDGDGRDANPSDPGDWVSAAEASTTFRGCSVVNSSWHGTRVSGIIAARANNSEGIAGVTWAPWVLPVRVIGKCGGFDSDILAALRWAAGLHVDGVPDNAYPAQVVNLSLGSIGPCPASYTDVIAEVVAAGTLVVASAGNEGGPVASPANCPGVAAIAGVRHIGTKVGYSSLGREVALSAPAGNCVNTNGGACLFSIDTTSNAGDTAPSTHIYTDQLNFTVCTSFSSPMVAGVAALMLSLNGNLKPAQTIARLKEGAATPFPRSPELSVPTCHVPVSRFDIQNGECNCTTDTCGAGMANIPGALKAALRPIAAVAVTGTFAPGSNIALSGAGSAAACGHAIARHEWTSLDPGGPGITGTDPAVAVVFVPAAGSYRLRLTITDDAGRQDEADVTVTPTAASTAAPSAAGTDACLAAIAAPSISITLAPRESSVELGATQAFTATVANAADTGVTWQVAGVPGGNATVGTITADGLFSAPAAVPSPATVVVTAVANADPTVLETATVTVVPRVPRGQAAASSGGGGAGGAALRMLCASLLLRRRRRFPIDS